LLIDSSPAIDYIPLGEDIIYSSLCQAVQNLGSHTLKWFTHVLLTEKGFVYTTHLGGVSYYDWSEVRGIYFSKFIEVSSSLKFFLKREPKFETKEGFKKRKKEFGNKIKPIMRGRKEEWIKKFPNKKERKKEIRKSPNFFDLKI